MTCRGMSALTPGAERTVNLCRRLAHQCHAAHEEWPVLLVLALLRDESLAAASLAQLGASEEGLLAAPFSDLAARLPAAEQDDSEPNAEDPANPLPDDPNSLISVIDAAKAIARRCTDDGMITSSVLLLAAVQTSEQVSAGLDYVGITPTALSDMLFPVETVSSEPIPIDEPLFASAPATAVVPLNHTTTSNAADDHDAPLYRVLDACLNRAREGLRVLEDYCRFFEPQSQLLPELKSLRHELCAAEQLDSVDQLLSRRLLARDTTTDAGTEITHQRELTRSAASQLVTANLRRVQESLRSLEEFGKLLSSEFAAIMKQLRYRTYMLEQPLLLNHASTSNRTLCLQQSQLYVLVTEELCRLPWKTVVQQILAGGTDIVQLREKHSSDREVLSRSRWIADACEEAGALFILNDRADLAVAANADGVHVGQDEIPAVAARDITGPEALVGLSTHTTVQLNAALDAPVDYIGVGPVFPGKTKTFSEFPGVPYVSVAARECPKPWFAIGGINTRNLPQLTAVGCRRIAVTASVIGTDCPQQAAADLRALLPSLTSPIESDRTTTN